MLGHQDSKSCRATSGVLTLESPEVKGRRVGQFIAGKGFILADSIGHACRYGEGNCIGFLKDNPNRRPVTFFGIKKVWCTRRDFIGELWLDNDCRNANIDSNWVFEVYGRENLNQLQRLAEELTKEFYVNIKIILRDEYAMQERFFDDGGM